MAPTPSREAPPPPIASQPPPEGKGGARYPDPTPFPATPIARYPPDLRVGGDYGLCIHRPLGQGAEALGACPLPIVGSACREPSAGSSETIAGAVVSVLTDNSPTIAGAVVCEDAGDVGAIGVGSPEMRGEGAVWGDNPVCKVTPVILHGETNHRGSSPEEALRRLANTASTCREGCAGTVGGSGDFVKSLRSSYTGWYPQTGGVPACREGFDQVSPPRHLNPKPEARNPKPETESRNPTP